MLEDEIREMLIKPPHIEFLVAAEREPCAAAGAKRRPEREVLRVLVVYAHPLETSLVSAAHARVVETLRMRRPRGRRSRSLCGEVSTLFFRPNRCEATSTSELNTREVETYVERLRAAEALVLVFPVWFDGLPAIMQGYFQRVFLPGVATVIDESGLFHPNLRNLKRMAAVCAYGESRADVAKKQDPARRFVRDNIGALIDPNGRFEYLALYGMDFSTPARRAAFLRRVTRAFRRLVGAHGGSSAASSDELAVAARAARRRSRRSSGSRPPRIRHRRAASSNVAKQARID